MDAQERPPDALGARVILRGACNSPEHDRAVGGAQRSKHKEAIKFDVATADHDARRFEVLARDCDVQGFGFHPRSGFTHIDLCPARECGERFPPRATRFEIDRPVAGERHAGLRAIKGGGLAGPATLAGAGPAVAEGREPRAPLLAHADCATSERHYVHAQGIEAGRDYAAVVAAMKAGRDRR